MRVCVRVCMRVCVRACVFVCVCVSAGKPDPQKHSAGVCEQGMAMHFSAVLCTIARAIIKAVV
jgi:hypothetical protein